MHRSIDGTEVVIDVALHAKTVPTTLKEIYERQEIALDNLKQIINQLLDVGILIHQKENQNGYMLARSPDKISLREIILAMTLNNRTITARIKGVAGNCGAVSTDIMQKLWPLENENTKQMFNEITIADLLAHRA